VDDKEIRMRNLSSPRYTHVLSIALWGILGLIGVCAIDAQAQTLPNYISGLPGDPSLAATGEVVNDQKTGSVLFFNYYTSDSLSSTVNTRVSLTNVNPVQDIAVHIFLVDTVSCNVADFFICLTRNQTTTFVTSELDPNVSGYLVAVAVDSEGKPTSFNYLAGEEYVVAPTGHRFGLSAVAAARHETYSSPINSDGLTSTIFLNGSQYDLLPRALMLDSFPSQVSTPGFPIGDTRMYVYSPQTNLIDGSGYYSGSLFFLIADDQENSFSGQLPLVCYITSDKQRISSVRTAPNLSSIVPPGRTGWARFYATGSVTAVSDTIGGTKTLDGAPLLGAVTTRLSAYYGGHNMRYITSYAAGYSISIPVIPPDCGPSNYLPQTSGSTL